jgi:hypothetical protein
MITYLLAVVRWWLLNRRKAGERTTHTKYMCNVNVESKEKEVQLIISSHRCLRLNFSTLGLLKIELISD